MTSNVKDQADPGDRRRFHRILFDAPVTIEAGGVSLEATLLDISLKGALVNLPGTWTQEMNQEIRLHIPLDRETNFIRMKGLVIHRKVKHIGVQCLHLDIDSVTHLRRLVELNLGQPELLERELEALG